MFDEMFWNRLVFLLLGFALGYLGAKIFEDLKKEESEDTS